MSAAADNVRFAAMAAALRRAGVAWPAVVIDRPRLETNIAIVRQALAGTGLALRLAAKSLQAPDLLRLVMERAATHRLMVFNGAMLKALSGVAPAAEALLGRPLPEAEAAPLIAGRVGAPQWLIDTPQRLAQYLAIARAHEAPVRVSFEIDVGLRRGGFADPAGLAAAIDLALAEPLASLAGLMGYDAHVAGARQPAAAAARAEARYRAFAEVLTAKTGRPASDFTLNTAGSRTWRLHLADRWANEVSIGSAFLKPANYDAPTLADLAPACFIAQPVLKVTDPARAPGREAPLADGVRGVFLYGGYGEAEPVWPAGLAWSPAWGARGMLEAPAGVAIGPDDFVFLRPRESEGALTHLGDIAVFDGADIAGTWTTFPQAG